MSGDPLAERPDFLPERTPPMSDDVEPIEPDVLAGAMAYLQEGTGYTDAASVNPDVLARAVRIVCLVLMAADTARAAQPPMPRLAGPVNTADALALRLELGAEAVAIVAWMPGDDVCDLVLAAGGNRALRRRCSGSKFSDLSASIAAAFPEPSPLPAAPAPAPAEEITS